MRCVNNMDVVNLIILCTSVEFTVACGQFKSGTLDDVSLQRTVELLI